MSTILRWEDVTKYDMDENLDLSVPLVLSFLSSASISSSVKI
jgi:hypothetical protein